MIRLEHVWCTGLRVSKAIKFSGIRKRCQLSVTDILRVIMAAGTLKTHRLQAPGPEGPVPATCVLKSFGFEGFGGQTDPQGCGPTLCLGKQPWSNISWSARAIARRQHKRRSASMQNLTSHASVRFRGLGCERQAQLN